MLAETVTTEISQVKNPNGLSENKVVAKEGGTIAGNVRVEIEAKTGRKVIAKKMRRD